MIILYYLPSTSLHVSNACGECRMDAFQFIYISVAIKTFKAHFIAGLAGGLPASIPLHLWLPQAELTVNLLRPPLSAYADLFGQYDFNRTPIAPVGCEIQALVKPADTDLDILFDISLCKSQPSTRSNKITESLVVRMPGYWQPLWVHSVRGHSRGGCLK